MILNESNIDMPEETESIPTIEQRKILWQALTLAALFFLILAGVVIFSGLIQLAGLLASVLIPLSVAAVISILLEPVVSILMSRTQLKRSPAIILVLVLFFLLVIVAIWGLILTFLSFGAQLPALLDRFRLLISNTLSANPEAADSVYELVDLLREAVPQVVVTIIGPLVGSVLGQISLILGFIFVPIYVYFLLLGQSLIKHSWQEYIPLPKSALRDEIVVILTEISSYIITFFRGQVLIAIIVGAIITVGLWIVGLDYALLLGFFAGFAGIIPYLGALIAILPGIFLAYVQSGGDIGFVLLASLPFIIASQAESLYIGPKVMGNRTGLHPMTVIVSMLVWSILLNGLLGLILAVPLTATLKVLMYRYFWEPQKSKMADQS